MDCKFDLVKVIQTIIKRLKTGCQWREISVKDWAIQTEVEMKLGKTDYSEDLTDLVSEVRSHTWELEDAWWQSKDFNN